MTDPVKYLDIADVLIIAAELFEGDAQVVAEACKLTLLQSALGAPQASFGDVEFVTDIRDKIGILGYRILKNHAFLDGNKRIAFLSMLEMVARNNLEWNAPTSDGEEGDETVAVIMSAAAGELSEEAFLAWTRQRIVTSAS